MNTDKHTEEREAFLLTDADLDAVVGGAVGDGKVTIHDIHIVKQVDKASPVLHLG
jgi:type VI protein secretion system component Hcp